jgi:hypothetical protein
MAAPRARAWARGIALFIGTIAFVVVIIGAVRGLVLPRPPPSHVPVPPPMGPALTQHLALIIVDGLRYDTATDDALMPAMAERMRTHTSAEIWASKVSMTSSAILTYSTGQRGDIDQIVNNESGSPPVFNDLIHNARAAALTTACVGDRTWFSFFPDAWSYGHPDPHGLAIDVDYNAEIFAAAYETIAKRPNLFVLHFVTPDHQAHAHGVTSARYRAHIRAFDATLTELLVAIPPEFTVFLTSDHGATDTGTHGSDTPIQRRSPILAYGPGIVPARHEGQRFDQVDLPSTFAALLGIAAPAHSRGHLLSAWIDAPDDRKASMARADLARLTRYAAGHLPASHAAYAAAATPLRALPFGEQVTQAARRARSLDAALERASMKGSPMGWLAPILAIAGAIVLSLATFGRGGRAHRAQATKLIAVSLGLIGVSSLLTHSLERLPGQQPNIVRVVLYAAVNLAIVAAIIRPRAAAAWLDSRGAIAAAWIPGLLIVTPPKTTQPEAFALAFVLALFTLTVGLPHAEPVKPTESWRRRLVRVAGLAPWLALLGPIAFRESRFLPRAIATPSGLRAAACAAIVVFAALHVFRARERRALSVALVGELALGAALAAAPLWLRLTAPGSLCIAGWLGLAGFAWFAYRRGRRPLAELLALASYGWVSRDAELPILIGTYVVARAVGESFARDLAERPQERPRPSLILFIATFLFAWAYIQRIGVGLGIDFTHLDFGAGTFREPGVSMARIAAGLIYKHGLAWVAVAVAVLSPLNAQIRIKVVRVLLIASLVRVAALTTLLYVCRDSFWTSLRIIGDLPHALLASALAAAAYLLVVAHSSKGDSHPEELTRSETTASDKPVRSAPSHLPRFARLGRGRLRSGA